MIAQPKQTLLRYLHEHKPMQVREKVLSFIKMAYRVGAFVTPKYPHAHYSRSVSSRQRNRAGCCALKSLLSRPEIVKGNQALDNSGNLCFYPASAANPTAKYTLLRCRRTREGCANDHRLSILGSKLGQHANGSERQTNGSSRLLEVRDVSFLVFGALWKPSQPMHVIHATVYQVRCGLTTRPE